MDTEDYLATLADKFGGYWDGEHPYFTLEAWHYAVNTDDTRSGYWAWVESAIEETGCTCNTGGSAGCPAHDEAVG